MYSVERTDRVGPGEFMNALVIAGGTAQARKAVSHMSGVNIRVTRIDTTKRTMVLGAYWDEREPEPAAQSETLF